MLNMSFFLIGFALGLLTHAALSYWWFCKDEDKKERRGSATVGPFTFEHKIKCPKQRPVIIKTTDDSTARQQAQIRENQERGDSTSLEDIT